MSRSIWRSTNSCPDLEPGMVIKYSCGGIRGYYLVTYKPEMILALTSIVTPIAGQGHFGPVIKSGILEVWATLYDFLMDNGVEVLRTQINF